MTRTQATLGEIPRNLPYISINVDVPQKMAPMENFFHAKAVAKSAGKSRETSPPNQAPTAAFKGIPYTWNH